MLMIAICIWSVGKDPYTKDVQGEISDFASEGQLFLN